MDQTTNNQRALSDKIHQFDQLFASQEMSTKSSKGRLAISPKHIFNSSDLHVNVNVNSSGQSFAQEKIAGNSNIVSSANQCSADDGSKDTHAVFASMKSPSTQSSNEFRNRTNNNNNRADKFQNLGFFLTDQSAMLPSKQFPFSSPLNSQTKRKPVNNSVDLTPAGTTTTTITTSGAEIDKYKKQQPNVVKDKPNHSQSTIGEDLSRVQLSNSSDHFNFKREAFHPTSNGLTRSNQSQLDDKTITSKGEGDLQRMSKSEVPSQKLLQTQLLLNRIVEKKKGQQQPEKVQSPGTITPITPTQDTITKRTGRKPISQSVSMIKLTPQTTTSAINQHSEEQKSHMKSPSDMQTMNLINQLLSSTSPDGRRSNFQEQQTHKIISNAHQILNSRQHSMGDINSTNELQILSSSVNKKTSEILENTDRFIKENRNKKLELNQSIEKEQRQLVKLRQQVEKLQKEKEQLEKANEGEKEEHQNEQAKRILEREEIERSVASLLGEVNELSKQKQVIEQEIKLEQSKNEAVIATQVQIINMNYSALAKQSNDPSFFSLQQQLQISQKSNYELQMSVNYLQTQYLHLFNTLQEKERQIEVISVTKTNNQFDYNPEKEELIRATEKEANLSCSLFGADQNKALTQSLKVQDQISECTINLLNQQINRYKTELLQVQPQPSPDAEATSSDSRSQAPISEIIQQNDQLKQLNEELKAKDVNNQKTMSELRKQIQIETDQRKLLENAQGVSPLKSSKILEQKHDMNGIDFVASQQLESQRIEEDLKYENKRLRSELESKKQEIQKLLIEIARLNKELEFSEIKETLNDREEEMLQIKGKNDEMQKLLRSNQEKNIQDRDQIIKENENYVQRLKQEFESVLKQKISELNIPQVSAFFLRITLKPTYSCID